MNHLLLCESFWFDQRMIKTEPVTVLPIAWCGCDTKVQIFAPKEYKCFSSLSVPNNLRDVSPALCCWIVATISLKQQRRGTAVHTKSTQQELLIKKKKSKAKTPKWRKYRTLLHAKTRSLFKAKEKVQIWGWGLLSCGWPEWTPVHTPLALRRWCYIWKESCN